ncbi:MAG: T9SS type A sorting domain-containing protein [Flavobacteriaceae bacterium]
MKQKATLLIVLFITGFGFAQTKSGKSQKTSIAISFNVASGAWSTAGNWSSSQVPTGGDNVTILAGQTVNIGVSNAVTNNLTIDATANVNVNVGGGLTINGTFTNNAILTVNSDATGTGSVIAGAIGGGSGTDRFNRYLTGGTNWHLIASPLAFSKVNNFFTDNGGSMTTSGTDYSMATYDNTKTIDVDTWFHFTTGGGSNPPTSANFAAGKGYEILMDASGTVLFKGAIKTGDDSIAATVGNTGWNLIGNPYTSFMYANSNANATNFISTNSANMDSSFVAIYVWNPGTSSYDLVNQASAAYTMPPAQGFFIKSKAGGATFNFTTGMQTHSGNNFQKTVITGIPTINLSVDNNSGIVSSTEIKYMSGTTLGLDPGYDAGRFGAVDTGFNVYTHLVQDNGVAFALQVVPETGYDTTVIPIGIDASNGAQLTFKATATDLPTGKKVFLEDKLLNTVTEINNTDKSYTITLSSSLSGTGRFYMHTQDNASTLAVEDFNTSQYTLIATPKNNNLKLYGAVTQKGSIVIYDSLGRSIFTTSLIKGTEQDIAVPNMATGVYFVKATIDGKPLSKKIVWY